ncbi:MAG: hypothetical protein RLZZ126_442 [Pseudomonadota bacterium]|jgi:signal transduction histidine kinase
MTAEGQSRLRILFLEDSEPDFGLAVRALAQAGLSAECVRVQTLLSFEAALKPADQASAFDLVLADYHLPGFTALDAQQLMLQSGHALPFVLVSGAVGDSTAVAAIQAGMADFVAKDDLHRLGPAVQRALSTHATRLAKEQADAELAASRERLAEFAKQEQTAIENERAAIARDIHDDVGGALAALRFDLSWLSQRHAQDASTQTRLRQAEQTLAQAVQASQAIMHNLRPAVLDEGLAAGLEWLAHSFSQRNRLPVHARIELSAGSATALSADQQLTAYRTAQEALTNIQKHAQATQVWVEASDRQGLLTLEVRDDGSGLPHPLHRAGRGLAGMRERAGLAGGWLDIGPGSQGHGTCITLSIPLSDRD